MHHHITQVHQYPLSGVTAFHTEHRGACLTYLVVHALRERPSLAVAGAAGNHHAVKQAGYWPSVEDLNVLGFHIFQGIYNKKLKAIEVCIQGGAPNTGMLNRVGLVNGEAVRGLDRVGGVFSRH